MKARSIAPGSAVERYVILETLGRGGAGEVYAAYDPKLDRKIALKILREGNESLQERLLREAQAMARLVHPNVVSVFDTGVDGRRAFITMEFVRGQTLRKWQVGRPWTDVLRAYVDAGNGLAAAHAAALVHRDFKPENVLVSDDGGVKVTDFGIVHTLGDPREVSTPTPRSGDALPKTTNDSGDGRMTEDGTLIGTPGYMAPEQYMGEPIDARTDQFSFCVSLYEALYGEKPFAAGSKVVIDILEATLNGALRPPPKGTSVSPHVYDVIVRGLSAKRDDRYPSMRALLTDLARDPRRERRRMIAIASAAIAAAAAVVITTRAVAARDAREQRLCGGADAEVAEIWNPTVQERIERALLATGAPYAADTWRRTREEIDRVMGAWATMYRQSCEATRVRQTQSESVMTARMACLERRRDGVGALLNVLGKADRDVASRALPAVRELPSLDECKDVESLMAAEREPKEPAAAAEIASIRKALSEVGAALDLERLSAAKSQIEPLVARARSVGYRPLLADVMLASSHAKSDDASSDGWLDDAIESVTSADIARADRTRAEAATWITISLSNTGRLGEAEQWSRFADAALHRAGNPAAGRASWLTALERLRYEQGRSQDAVVAERQALALARSAGLPETRIADYERVLAMAVADVGDTQAAKELAEDADRVAARIFGEEHPRRLRFLGAQSYVCSVANDTQGGFEYLRRAAELGERVAPESPYLGTVYANACWLLYGSGDDTSALPYCEKAVATTRRTEGAESTAVAYAYRDRGDVLRALGRYADADADYERAIRIHERVSTKHANYVFALGGLGRSRLLAGKPREAVEILERAIAAAADADLRSNESQTILAETEFALARALWETAKDKVRAEQIAQQAGKRFTQAKRDDLARHATDWVTAHHRH